MFWEIPIYSNELPQWNGPPYIQIFLAQISVSGSSGSFRNQNFLYNISRHLTETKLS